MSPQDTPVLERAYQIARSGVCASLSELRLKLKQEGYPYRDVEVTPSAKAPDASFPG